MLDKSLVAAALLTALALAPAFAGAGPTPMAPREDARPEAARVRVVDYGGFRRRNARRSAPLVATPYVQTLGCYRRDIFTVYGWRNVRVCDAFRQPLPW